MMLAKSDSEVTASNAGQGETCGECHQRLGVSGRTASVQSRRDSETGFIFSLEGLIGTYTFTGERCHPVRPRAHKTCALLGGSSDVQRTDTNL